MKRWKTPILAFGEKFIRRRATARFHGESTALAPDIVTIAVDPKGKVEIKGSAARFRHFSERLHLLLSLPLYVEVVLLVAFIIVRCAQCSVARHRLPVIPGLPLTFNRGAKCGIIFDRRIVFYEASKARSSFGRCLQDGAGQLFENAPLDRHQLPIVDERFAGQPFRRVRVIGRADHSLSRRRIFKLRNFRHIEIEFVPEKAADGCVGAGLEEAVKESSEQRQRAYGSRADSGGELSESSKIRKIPCFPALFRGEGIDWTEKSPALRRRIRGKSAPRRRK